MKKIVYVLFGLLLFSCSKRTDEKTFTIEDFTKKRIDTLMPDKNEIGYYSSIIKVKGFVNDTIKIQSNDFYDIFLSGKIDEIYRRDYYGGLDVIFSFDPYKANKGKLEIEYKLVD